jgi:hypothetical protein
MFGRIDKHKKVNKIRYYFGFCKTIIHLSTVAT